MIDHVSVSVSDVAVSRDFYEKALAPLGYVIVMQFPKAVGFGVAGKPDFWIGARGPGTVHVAFAATAPSCSTRTGTTSKRCATVSAGGSRNLFRHWQRMRTKNTSLPSPSKKRSP